MKYRFPVLTYTKVTNALHFSFSNFLTNENYYQMQVVVYYGDMVISRYETDAEQSSTVSLLKVLFE